MGERRTYTAEFKAKVVLEIISGEKGLMQASREYEIKDTVLSRWKQEFMERAHHVFEKGQKAGNEQEERIAELERKIGRMAIELDIAKKAYGISSHRSKSGE